MWCQSFEFHDRHPPATPNDIAAFRAPLPEAEHANALNYLESYAAQLSATGYCLPPHFYIPNELMQLWQYSVRGGITGNGQDFGYSHQQKLYLIILATSSGITRLICCRLHSMVEACSIVTISGSPTL